MPTALPFIMAAASVAKGIQGYKQNQAMAKAVGRQADANIQNERNTQALRQQQLKREQDIIVGKQTVAAAGSGATLGSFDALFSDNSETALMDRLMSDYDSKLSQENIRYNAAVQKAEYKAAAKSSLIEGISSAAMGMAGSPAGQKAMTGFGNSAGQSVGRAVSRSPTGPYLKFGSSLLSGY
jgi:hypothetical protein